MLIRVRKHGGGYIAKPVSNRIRKKYAGCSNGYVYFEKDDDLPKNIIENRQYWDLTRGRIIYILVDHATFCNWLGLDPDTVEV